MIFPHLTKNIFRKRKYFQLKKNVIRYKVIVATIIFFFLALIIPNNKFLFILTSSYFFAIFLFSRSILETIVLSFLPFSALQVGQMYEFLVIPRRLLWVIGYPKGRVFTFAFTPLVALELSAIALVLLLNLRLKVPRLLKVGYVCYWLWLATSLISATKGIYFPHLSVLYFFQDLGFFSIIILGCHLLLTKSLIKKKEFFSVLLAQIIIITLFHCGIVFLQMFRSSSLGLIIEQSQESPTFGVSADESRLFFRPIGLFTHANILAFELMNLFFAQLVIFFRLWEKKHLDFPITLTFLSTGTLGLAIVLTQTRAVYVALMISLFCWVLLNKQKLRLISRSLLEYAVAIRPVLYITLPFAFAVIANRVAHSVYSFSEHGGNVVRNLLLKEAWNLFQKNLIWGTGIGMFIPTAFSLNPRGVLRFFPESVHNGLVLILVERGLLAFLCLFLAFYFLIRAITKSSHSKNVKSLLYFWMIAQIIVSFFQPFSNSLTILTFVSFLLLAEDG